MIHIIYLIIYIYFSKIMAVRYLSFVVIVFLSKVLSTGRSMTGIRTRLHSQGRCQPIGVFF